MEIRSLIFFVLLSFLALPLVFAGGDRIEMEDGTEITGDIVTRNSSQIYVDTAKEVKRVDVSEIKTIHFGPVLVSKPKIPQDPQPSKEISSS